ncbi:MAG: GAF domain-containing protein, partial [Chloroflexi bacterium]|nr:GAF domain-containing protein [Chloroflexota bacterium]
PEAAQAVSSTLNLDEVVRRILAQLKRVLTYDTASVLLMSETGEPTLVIGAGYIDERSTSQASSDLLAKSPILAQMARDLKPVIIADVRDHPGWIWVPGAEHTRSFLAVPIAARERMIGALIVDNTQLDFFDETHARLAGTLAQHISVAIENARLFESLANEQHNTARLYHLSLELTTNLDPEDVAKRALQAATDALGVSRGNILIVENDSEHMRLLAVTGYDRETVSAINRRLNWNTSQGVSGRVVQTRTAAIVPDVSQDPFWVSIPGLDDSVKSIVSVPLITGDVVVGVLNLLSEEFDFFKPERLPLITAIASPVALALQNASLYESLRQRFKELEILADTSSALRKAGSYDDIPPILLAKAVEGLKADAGVLLQLENEELKFTALHGETSASTGDTCPPDAGMMWQVLKNGKLLFIPDVSQVEELHKNAICQALMGDALSCACVPLRTTTSAIGVVFLNWKKKSFLSADESRLLESLAEIAANAIHRSTLHLQTVQQAQDLTLAYDATIEGWSRALDLRDKETEGHSQRVTNLTLQLAQALGVNKSELKHIRRGALLHDIGKMGIPDNILRKTGALNDEEWTMMRRHPQLAYEMLFPIAYLQPALDIPYCHHEKWDGTGYPRGLKGEEIPLTARIFAVVDVFDALTSDRPYRPAWTKRKTTAHIRQQAGLHFDPKVVDIFLKMIRKK